VQLPLDQGLLSWFAVNGNEFMVSVSVFLDESGKFKDHKVITFGGIAAPSVEVNAFAKEWMRCLYINGIPALTMKQALRANRPLSDRNPSLGIEARIAALLPFIECIRQHIQVALGTALDVEAFKKLPSHCHQTLGNDPFFTAFLRTILEALELTHEDDKLTLICDDEEEMAEAMYKLYRRVKLVNPDARNKMKGLCFADDEWLYALQGADMVSSLLRREASKLFFQTPYDYEPLFAALTSDLDPSKHKMWACNFAFAGNDALRELANDLNKTSKPNEATRSK
jgi:hypothetical protein